MSSFLTDSTWRARRPDPLYADKPRALLLSFRGYLKVEEVENERVGTRETRV